MKHTHYGNRTSIMCPRCDSPVRLGTQLINYAVCAKCSIEIQIEYDITSVGTVVMPDDAEDLCAVCHFERWLHSQNRATHVAVCAEFQELLSRNS